MADPSCTHFFWSCTDHYLVVPTPSTPPAAPDCTGLQQLFITPSEVQWHYKCSWSPSLTEKDHLKLGLEACRYAGQVR